MKQTVEQLEFIFKALSDSKRLQILEILKKPGKSACGLVNRSERGLCSCDIQEEIGLSQGATSHHMDILARAGLVIAEKRERWMFYSRNEAALADLAEALIKLV
jgi:ArsR family transcriptional regulator